MPAKNKKRPAATPLKSKSLKKVSGGNSILPGDDRRARMGGAAGSEITPLNTTSLSRPVASNH
jgi:hypothetical protein